MILSFFLGHAASLREKKRVRSLAFKRCFYMVAMKEFDCKLDDILAVGFMELDKGDNNDSSGGLITETQKSNFKAY